MTQPIKKMESGWRCERCSLNIEGLQDVMCHARFFHRLKDDFIAVDTDGNIFDTSSVDTPTILRELGAL